ncbi:hypothetical protein [Pyxidicoccus xibeiensis]|uniref:hypothetical protein n=1 Tax=Pyxidicoccus xibeiensis TaxID=2906759 RepID=UPI0020A7B460|nr:hypothetical protein [Pyxidicoccus xibeiensis]MCP3139494.1 hypothetical protein [Pyxidicoccus xibeiensis]
MKVVSWHELKPADRLWLSFRGAFDPKANLEAALEPFLQTLEANAGGWMPDVIKGKRSRKYSRAAVWKSLDERRDGESTSIGLYRTRAPALDMTLTLWSDASPELKLMFHVQPLSVFSGVEDCDGLVEMVRAWAAHYPVTHCWAHSMADDELAGGPYFGRDLQTTVQDGFDRIYELSWLNIFGPKLVETVGRERLLSTPAHRVEALPHGAILLVTWPTAADFASDEARQAQARAFVHLRPELDYATVLRTLRERSAALAPVEPRFPPDVAGLLERTLERTAFSQRSRRIAELNAWTPPEPEEWLPASACLPMDVEDAQREQEHYAYLAERCVALLHTEVPSVFQETPESLTDADAYFWKEEFPQTRSREAIEEHAVPAVGAYLGEVLVRNLGGQWIPRRKLEEAQVRVGQRVWLPFLRARRYLRSNPSLLDYSLTQLYRVAARFQS